MPGRWRSRCSIRGRTSSTFTWPMSHFDSTTIVEQFALRADVGDRPRSWSTSPSLASDENERDVRSLGCSRVSAAPSSTRSPGAGGAAARPAVSTRTKRSRRARTRCRSRHGWSPGTLRDDHALLAQDRSSAGSTCRRSDAEDGATRIVSSADLRRPGAGAAERRSRRAVARPGAVAGPTAGSARRAPAGGTRARAFRATGRRSCSRAGTPDAGRREGSLPPPRRPA
jgi:hypothetical protein